MNKGHINITLLMKCKEKQIISNEIVDHVIQSQYLYDFKKKKISITKKEARSKIHYKT